MSKCSYFGWGYIKMNLDRYAGDANCIIVQYSVGASSSLTL